jgi:hypothetical protein
LLLQPFVAAAIIAGFWHWLLLPTLALILLGFLLKEPLLVLARQRWVWRSPNPQTPVAARWLAAELFGITVCVALLAAHTPIVPLATLAAAALALTLTAVWFTLKNKQRSVLLQILSTAGLSTSALLVALVSEQHLPLWVWVLWGMLTLHAVNSILVVHTRLERVVARKTTAQGRHVASHGHIRSALLASLFQAIAAATAIAAARPEWALPFLLSIVVNSAELYGLKRAGSLDEPLKRVGYRALSASIVHMAVTVAALWNTARV